MVRATGFTDEALQALSHERQSLLCVGLDPHPDKLPLCQQDVVAFCRDIITATAPYALAFKVNFAYFEALGRRGWDALYQVREALPAGALLIADAKRGDVGHTAERYAHAIFDQLQFDAVTLSPYLGFDSVAPFLAYDNRWVFLLGLTSNPGAADIQQLTLADGRRVHQAIVETAQSWGRKGELGYVAGATRPEALATIRKQVPHSWLLVPGIGAQGGTIQEVMETAGARGRLLLTASRSILFASSAEDYAEAAGKVASTLQKEMAAFLLLI